MNPYAAERIEASYDNTAQLLEECPGMRLDAAYDVGSGAGHESFGLGAWFDRVLAVDFVRRAVWEGRRAAKAAGVERVRFERRDVETWRPDERSRSSSRT